MVATRGTMSKDHNNNNKSNNSKKTTHSRSDDINRRKRRAERNHLRTIKHIHKLLDQIVEGVGTGFNHHGWCNAASALQQASSFLEPQEHKAIGNAWAPLYAESVTSNDQLAWTISKIKERVAGNLLEIL